MLLFYFTTKIFFSEKFPWSKCESSTNRQMLFIAESFVSHKLYCLFCRIDPVPVAHITQCILQQAPSNQGRKEPGRERSKSIKIKLTKATNRLFQRKSGSKFEYEADIIMNEFAREQSDEMEFSSKTTSGTLHSITSVIN